MSNVIAQNTLAQKFEPEFDFYQIKALSESFIIFLNTFLRVQL